MKHKNKFMGWLERFVEKHETFTEYFIVFIVSSIIPLVAGLIWGYDGFMVALFLQGWFGTFFL